VASEHCATGGPFYSLVRACRAEIMRVQQGKHRDDNASLRMLIELRNTKADEMEKMRRTAELTYEKQLEQEAEAESMVEEYYAAFGQLKVRNLLVTIPTSSAHGRPVAGDDQH